jgi:hypothetical protein
MIISEDTELGEAARRKSRGFWEIASLPIGFLTPFSVRSSRRLRNSLRSDILAQKKGQSPFFIFFTVAIIRKRGKIRKKGTVPFSVLEERTSKAKSSMVASAISQNL